MQTIHTAQMFLGTVNHKRTLIPSNLDKARRGLRALRVLRDFIGPRSEYPIQLATKLIKEICGRIKIFPIQALSQTLSGIKHVSMNYMCQRPRLKQDIKTYIYYEKV